jgi:glycosyltransferase involved in cell wall biosynthesis
VGLIRAFVSVADKIPHDLVVVGKKEGFITNEDRADAEAGFLRDRVRFTGYIDDKSLRQYFTHADVLVFPSLYEGFGLPPLEAMAAGCPVIVSDIPSLAEVCGDAALYCDPRNPAHIADTIKRLIDNPPLQEELRERGQSRARQFTYEKCAQETVAVIEGVLEK